MDLKALGDWIAADGFSFLLTAAALSFAFFVLVRLMKRWSSIEDSVFSNWRLGLLGTTGIVLSLAAGWRTWEGMRNFTNEPVLSGMITFGIQGVMLIVAWLIGESFATGMSQGKRDERRGFGGSAQALIGSLVGLLAFAAVLAVALQLTGVVDVRSDLLAGFDWSQYGDTYLIAAAALLLLILVMFFGGDLVKPYTQSARVIVRNAMLWVMFLACMGASVFFSFDSFFSAIFPQDQRARAAEIRAQNQVAGIAADIGQTITSRRIGESEALFHAKGWRDYEMQLAGVAEAARQSEGAIERYFNDQIEQKNRAIKEQQERIATAQTGQAGLESRKTTLAGELARLKGERPTLLAEYGEKKADMDAKVKDVDAKRVEAMAEDKGVEGTGKEGKGPIYRERMAEFGKLQAAVKIGEERVKDAKKRLDAVDTRLAQVEREVAAVDGELAKFKGEAETASQRIQLTEAAVSVEAGQQIDPARMVPVFEKAKAEFRQQPTADGLAKVQQICGQIYGAMSAAEATKPKIKNFDCDPKEASEAAAVLFALNAGGASFDKNCSGGDKLARHNGTDALFGFARGCLADSGLPSKETAALRDKINDMELKRDDKAHRFVVTWNAFEDGNRLAYLALAIAIALDALIFMSGLFGANAVRSPLSDVPKARARSAQQLEATINAALGVRQYETASMVLASLRPTANADGFSAIAALDDLDRGARDRVRQVLTAGADIGAVEPAESSPETYRVRSEFREYLSTVCDKHLKTDPSHQRRDRLREIIRAALKPHPKEHAEIVANVFSPIQTTRGFSSMVSLREIGDAYDSRIVRRVINAGATVEAIAPDESEADRYYIRPELYETLLDISAHDAPSLNYEVDRANFHATPSMRASLPRPPAVRGHAPPLDGGSLTERAAAREKGSVPLEDPRGANAKGGKKRLFTGWFEPRLLEDHTAKAPPEPEGEAIDQSASEPEPPDEIVRAFASRLKVKKDQVKDLLDPRHVKVADHADKQLGTIADNDGLFRRRLGRLMDIKKRAIEQAERDLRDAGEDAAVAEGIAAYLARILPLVLLVEQGAYPRMLDDLLTEADDLEGQAFPGGLKRDWMHIVQDHRDALARLPRSEFDEWAPVQECLLRLSKGLAALRSTETARRHGQRFAH